ncbi:hypothetical protein [Flavobacterium sp. '19STA2R22 D10 B1']|uniref:hypothetical protein n=1 Tax=Flavobacterium aerium TaxID=3037261 RepID=UPI00278BD4AD|nr:hypothetical protein [Flavobacterium sp. '19STA2R22 D10 B1']
MKIIVKLVLFMFITFLSTPTIVSLIQKDVDVSMLYSMSEEENHKEIKEVKAELKYNFGDELLAFTPTTKRMICFEHLQKHDSLLEEIFSPPPEFI